MSVEADTLHYYAQLDRDNARDAAIEHEAEQITTAVYDWLSVRFGENAACALLPDNWIDDTPADTCREAREHYARWVRARAVDQLEA